MYELLLYGNMTQKYFARYIYTIFNDIIKIHTKYNEYENYINMYCKYLSLDFDTDDDIDDLEFTLKTAKKVFNFNANISVDIHILNQTFYDGLKILFRLVKTIMDDLDCNILLLEDGSKVILERKNNILYTHVHEGDETDYPFELLERKINVI